MDEHQQKISHQLQLLNEHRDTLTHYLRQQAMLGTAHTPPAITHGIQDARDNIQRIKNVLRQWNVQVEDHPDDEDHSNEKLNKPARSSKPNVPSTSSAAAHISKITARLYTGVDSAGYWPNLERSVIRAVTAGGVAAMSYYRQILPWQADLAKQDKNKKNPSTFADLEATAAILQAIDPYLAPLARRLGCSLMYLGEETGYETWLEENLSQEVFQRIKSPGEFFTEEGNVLRVIIDGIDGTGSFMRGIPLFCSAAAILLGTQPRVAAVYDPFHHIVYYAALQGPIDNPSAKSAAWAWQVAAGSRLDLVEFAEESRQQAKAQKEALAIHLTRSHPSKLREFIGHAPSTQSVLERLAQVSGAIYALNSGLVAMTDVARGALGGLVNNVTNLWDIAAGEVLVQACGGIVTNFLGEPIDYSRVSQSSVIAAREPLYTRILDILKE